ncbi:MAG: methyl-accepting chemotaxis protein [Methanoregula sp.]|nr:methyl-accepting chemotaxis protein [Methanoregula sp.]
MSFIDDMKIGKKMIGGFLIVVLILVVVAMIGYVNMGTMAAADTKLYTENTIAIGQLGAVDTDLQHMRAEVYRYVYVPESRAADKQVFTEMRSNIKGNIDKYRSKSLTDNEKAELVKFDTAYADFNVRVEELLIAADTNDKKSVDAALAAGSPLVTSRATAVTAISGLVDYNTKGAKTLSDSNTALYNSSAMMLILATIVGVIIAIALALYLSKSITGPLDLASKNLQEMGMGHLGNRLKMNRKDEIGEMATVMDSFSDNLQNSVVGTLKKIAEGDLTTDIKVMDALDEISPALISTTTALRTLVADTNMLAKAAMEGKLDTRADATKQKGDYRKIVEGVNGTLDAIIGPLNMSAEYMDRISKGDIPKKITDNYNGDFNEIKNNLNSCIDNINALTTDANQLAKGAVEGKLKNRSDATKHMGDYRKIMEGVNATLDAIINPLNMSAEYMERISKGDIPKKITDQYNGEFNEIKNNLNECIEALNGLQSDLSGTIQAQKVGDISARCTAKNLQGAYLELAKGVNESLDAISIPVMDSVTIMGEYAQGNFAREMRVLPGKQIVLTNGLNSIRTNVLALITDANMLAKAADEGKLKMRADASKHTGDYRKVIEGVNATLDSVVVPVNEALRVSKVYSTQDFTTRVDQNLKMPGDWLAFKEALDNIGVAVSAAITNISAQVTDLAAGAEEANASVEEVSAGAGQMARNTSAVSVNVEKSMAGIDQVQKAMEDLSRTIQEVATRADVTAKLVQDTTVFSKEGMELAQKTESGMQGITKSSNDVNVIILEIKGQMDKISEIVNLITDLANQTNLLALNAAIEAARAGDAGRGFAVVATEVKSLAVESRASAEKIADMISSLQTQTNSAVDAVASSNAGVKQGSEALQETLSSFSKIVTSIDQISKNISDVAAAAEEQAASVEEVTASINEVGGLMQSTSKESTDAAAASEESAAAIDQITKVVGNVNTIVDKVTKEVSRFKC